MVAHRLVTPVIGVRAAHPRHEYKQILHMDIKDLKKVMDAQMRSRYLQPGFFVRMPSGNIYVYLDSGYLVGHHEFNFGPGNIHWVELVQGNPTKEQLRVLYPSTSFREFDDSRTNKFIKGKILEMEKGLGDDDSTDLI
jgi:hypothetical protein